MKVLYHIIIFLLMLPGIKAQAQKALEITYERFGKVKIFEVPAGDVLRYKLKGDLFFRKSLLSNMNDSLLIMESDSLVKLSKIKAIKLNKGIHIVTTFQYVFIAGGVGFFGVSTINNIIGSRTPVFSDRVNYISAALVVSGLLIRQLNIKRISITKNKVLKVVEHNYQDLAKPPVDKPVEVQTGN